MAKGTRLSPGGNTVGPPKEDQQTLSDIGISTRCGHLRIPLLPQSSEVTTGHRCGCHQIMSAGETDLDFLLEVACADENGTIFFIDLVLYELSRRLLYNRSMLGYRLHGLLF